MRTWLYFVSWDFMGGKIFFLHLGGLIHTLHFVIHSKGVVKMLVEKTVTTLL